MALGRPISLTNNVASKIIRVLATNNQTVFTVAGGYRINQIGVFRNGVRLSNNSDFTALDGSTVTLINAAQTSDEVLFEIQDDFRVADAIVSAASTQTISGDLSITGDIDIGGSITAATISGAASQVTVADESSDTTCFPLFTTAATGNLPPKSGTNLTFNSSTGALTATSFVGDVTGNADTATNASGLTGTPNISCGTGAFSGNVTLQANLDLQDNDKILLGAGDDLEIYHDGSNSYIKDAGTGQLVIDGNAVVLQYGASSKLETSSAGVEVTGKLTFSGDGVSNGIELGADADLLLYHDNSNAYIDNNVGDFYIRNSGSNSNQVYISGKGGENGIIVNGDGSVELYNDNSKKLETSATGVTITGTVAATSFSGDGSNLTGLEQRSWLFG